MQSDLHKEKNIQCNWTNTGLKYLRSNLKQWLRDVK